MKKKLIIRELESISEHNNHVKSLLALYKGGYKSLDETMLEMIGIMAFDTYVLRDALNRERSTKDSVENPYDNS